MYPKSKYGNHGNLSSLFAFYHCQDLQSVCQYVIYGEKRNELKHNMETLVCSGLWGKDGFGGKIIESKNKECFIKTRRTSGD